MFLLNFVMIMNSTIDDFLHYMRYELNLSPRTVSLYRTNLTQWQQYNAGQHHRELDLTSVTATDIRAWLVYRSSQGDSPGTLRHKVQALRALYRYLMRKGIVNDNPAAQVELAKLPRRLPHVVRDNVVDGIIDAPIDQDDFIAVRDNLIIMLLYETGIRRAELIDLDNNKVDTTAQTIKVHGKRDKDRIIPIGPELCHAIDHYRILRAELPIDSDCLLLTEHGRPLYPSLVYKIVHNALQQAGATGRLSPHVLRHSFASTLLNHGAQLNSVKELLGHESLAATQVYTHISLGELKQNYAAAHPRAAKDTKNPKIDKES